MTTERDNLEKRLTNSTEEEVSKSDDRREAPDRRREPTRLISRYVFFGNRRVNRRATDAQKNYYVDRYSARAYGAVVAILLLCAADAVFTIYHLNRGATEVNPIMNFALSFGTLHFLIIKYVLTVAGLFVLLTHKNFIVARIATICITGMYALLLAYHLVPMTGLL